MSKAKVQQLYQTRKASELLKEVINPEEALSYHEVLKLFQTNVDPHLMPTGTLVLGIEKMEALRALFLAIHIESLQKE